MVKLTVVTDATCHKKAGSALGKSVGVAQYYDESGVLLEEVVFKLGEVSSYAAEYITVVNALDKASEITRGEVELWTDAEYIVRHMDGRYRLKSAIAKESHDKLKVLENRFQKVRYYHHERTARLAQSADTAAQLAYQSCYT